MYKQRMMLSETGNVDLGKAIVAVTLTNLSTLVPFIVIMQMMATVLDPLISGQALHTGRIWLLCGIGLLAALLHFFAYKTEYKKTYNAAYNESMNTRIAVAEHLRKLPLSFFNRKDLSELTTNIMGDCTAIEHTMSHVVPQLGGTLLSSLIACLMLAAFDWRMALAIFCALPISILLVFIGKIVEQNLAEQHVQAKLAVSGQVQEYLEGIKVVKAFGLGGEKFRALDAALRGMMQAAIRFEFLAGVFVSLAGVTLQAGMGIAVLVGASRLASGNLSIITFLTLVMVSIRIYAPLQSILTLLPALFYMLTSTERMRALRREPIMDGDSGAELSNFDIKLDKVSFAYNNENVIHNLSCRIPQGKVTALVGPSGSGKSTLSQLIARFWDVGDGQVRIGGRNVRDLEPEHLMSYMSFVFQDVILFNDSIAANIRLGRRDATREEMEDAARRARCHDFIMAMPNGYDSVIGENGCTLSGGERQRISIARAILKDSPIILLDEATASLDPENEILVQEAISELIKDRTVLVIAHRLRTIQDADQIIVLEQGKIREQGKHQELLNQAGLFQRLFRLQREGMDLSKGSA